MTAGRQPQMNADERRSGSRRGSFRDVSAFIGVHLRLLSGVAEVRFGLAAAALLLVAVFLQFPATRLHAKSRLESSPFKWTSDLDKRALEKKSYFLYLPKENSLRFFSLGNDALAAEYVWIKAAGYVTREWSTPGGEDRESKGKKGDREAAVQEKFEWLAKLYNTVQDLDPHWVGACRLGSMILAAVGKDPSGAIDLLERGMSANPDSWLLPYEAGVTMLMWPGHQEEVARYFKMAAQRPMDPERRETIRLIIPRLEAEAGRIDMAIRYARERAGLFEGQAMGDAAKRQLVEFVAQQLELALQDAVAGFRMREGRYPANIAELRRAGSLARFDVHFSKATVVYVDELKKLLGLFRRMNPRAPPLEGLRDYTFLATSGFLHKAVLAGAFDPPEWRDTYGRPFLYHAPTGTVRSEGYAEVRARRTAAILRSAAGVFTRRRGRRPGSLEELCRHFGQRIAEGRQLEMSWGEVFKTGRPPEHPLSAWGARYEYDPATGRVEVRERQRKGQPELPRGNTGIDRGKD